MNHANMTEHQQRIAAFMKLACQELPAQPSMPSENVRILRAKLILEEALETIEALGIRVVVVPSEYEYQLSHHQIKRYEISFPPNLTLIADGCADISVVTIGTLLACGIADKPLLEVVDKSNLAKFDLPKCPTHGESMKLLEGAEKYGTYYCTGDQCTYHRPGPYRRDDGKWCKSPDWKEPDIEGAIMGSDSPATMKSWTAEQFDEAKNQLIAFQEFDAAAELVKVIRKLRPPVPVREVIEEMYIGVSEEDVQASFAEKLLQREQKTPHCPHCRGILSQKLVSNIIEQKRLIPCPNCMEPVALESIIYA